MSVRNVQCPERPAIGCSMMHEVARPEVTAILGAQPDTMIHRPARAVLSLVVSLALRAPHVSTNARHVCHSPASRRLAAGQHPGDTHIDRTDAPARSYRQPDVPRRHAPVAILWQSPLCGSMQARRREGPGSFALRPRTGSICPVSHLKRHGEDARALSGAASVPQVILHPFRRTSSWGGNRSVQSHRSVRSHQSGASLAPPELHPAAPSRQSLRARGLLIAIPDPPLS